MTAIPADGPGDGTGTGTLGYATRRETHLRMVLMESSGELGHYTGIFHDIARCNHRCVYEAISV